MNRFPRISIDRRQVVEVAGQALAGDREDDDPALALAGAVVDDVRRPETAPLPQGVGDEAQGPAPIGPFGGKLSGRNFGVAPGRPGRFDITKLAPMPEDLHTRLSGVVIECLSYDGFIRRYDRPETLFHLDPPYWGCEKYHGKNMFGGNDFERLAG